MNTRVLGTLAIIGGVADIVSGVYAGIVGVTTDHPDITSQLIAFLWVLGAICGWLGFILIGGTGSNIVVRFLAFVPVIGLSLMFVFGLYGLITTGNIFGTSIVGLGFGITLLGTVFNCIFAIAMRGLPGWRRFAPLVVVLGLVFGVIFTVSFNNAAVASPIWSWAMRFKPRHRSPSCSHMWYNVN
jgi:hypothetical protein